MARVWNAEQGLNGGYINCRLLGQRRYEQYRVEPDFGLRFYHRQSGGVLVIEEAKPGYTIHNRSRVRGANSHCERRNMDQEFHQRDLRTTCDQTLRVIGDQRP